MQRLERSCNDDVIGGRQGCSGSKTKTVSCWIKDCEIFIDNEKEEEEFTRQTTEATTSPSRITKAPASAEEKITTNKPEERISKEKNPDFFFKNTFS